MRAGADARIVAIAPIGQVVATLLARPRVVGHLIGRQPRRRRQFLRQGEEVGRVIVAGDRQFSPGCKGGEAGARRSEEHTSELQSLMRISYAVFCLKKKKKTKHTNTHITSSQEST